MSNDPRQPRTLIDEAADEARDMAKQGMAHPSTKPVLIGLGLGAVRVAFSAALAGVVVAFAARTGALVTAGLACSGADGRVTAFFRAGAGVGGLSIAAFVAGAFLRLRLAAWVLMG